jgi:hypothetical protein
MSKKRRRSQSEIAAPTTPHKCVKCGSLKLSPIPDAPVIHRPIAGTLPDGFDYIAIRWTRVRCECGQVAVAKTYLP